MKRKRERDNSTLSVPSSTSSHYQSNAPSLPSSVIPSISGISSSVLAHSFQAPKPKLPPSSTQLSSSSVRNNPPSHPSSSLPSSASTPVSSSSPHTTHKSTNTTENTATTTTTTITSNVTTTAITQTASKVVTKVLPSQSSNWAKLKAKVARPSSSSAPTDASAANATTNTGKSSSITTTMTTTLTNISSSSQINTSADIKQMAIATIRGPFPVKPLSTEEQKYVALDCEMVGVGNDGLRSALALVVIVDYYGRIVYQKYVQPNEPVTDYRTFVSGIRPEHLGKAENFRIVQKEVSDIIRNKIIVGHGLINDMKALLLSHSWKSTRDTAAYRLFTFKGQGGKIRAKKLKVLVQQYLGIDIQTGEHEPAEDARAALALYKLFRRQWEHDEAGIKTDSNTNNGSTSKKQKI